MAAHQGVCRLVKVRYGPLSAWAVHENRSGGLHREQMVEMEWVAVHLVMWVEVVYLTLRQGELGAEQCQSILARACEGLG